MYEGNFINNRNDIQNWAEDLKAKHPQVERIFAGAGIKGGKGKLKDGSQVLFVGGMDENVAVRFLKEGGKIAGLGNGEEYPFLNALHSTGIIGTHAREALPSIKGAWARQSEHTI